MQDRTINNALLALRRDGGEAQVLAERLLAMRGVNYLPRMIQRPAKRGQMKRMILGALSDHPMKRKQMMAHLGPLRPELTPEQLYRRTDTALWRLYVAGLVLLEAGVWSLTPPAASSLSSSGLPARPSSLTP